MNLEKQNCSFHENTNAKHASALSEQVAELTQNLSHAADEKGSLQKYLEDRLQVLQEKENEIRTMQHEMVRNQDEISAQQLKITELKTDLKHEQDLRTQLESVQKGLGAEGTEMKVASEVNILT